MCFSYLCTLIRQADAYALQVFESVSMCRGLVIGREGAVFLEGSERQSGLHIFAAEIRW